MPNTSHPSEKIMRELIKEAWDDEKGIIAAVIDEQGMIVAKGETTILNENDPTAHAEINAIRAACKKLKTDKLPGYWLYSTFEPCPLCSSTIIWAGFEGVVYANNPDYKGKQENWSFIKCRNVLEAGKYINEVKLIENFLLDEIKDYFLLK
ncbi:MAG: nucleoside deaminase [Lachnospiraceae bacterium]|nr:nucleoside deaminase [Lachnospiraceae bacterium]